MDSETRRILIDNLRYYNCPNPEKVIDAAIAEEALAEGFDVRTAVNVWCAEMRYSTRNAPPVGPNRGDPFESQSIIETPHQQLLKDFQSLIRRVNDPDFKP